MVPMYIAAGVSLAAPVYKGIQKGIQTWANNLTAGIEDKLYSFMASAAECVGVTIPTVLTGVLGASVLHWFVRNILMEGYVEIRHSQIGKDIKICREIQQKIVK